MTCPTGLEPLEGAILLAVLGDFQDGQCALEVATDSGQVDLNGGFGEASPPHSAKAVASLPCSEDLLNPAALAMDRLVPFMKFTQRFLLVAAPHDGGDNSGNATFCTKGICEMRAAIGAVGENVAGFIRKRLGADFVIVDLLP